jgi:hypothetical protein
MVTTEHPGKRLPRCLDREASGSRREGAPRPAARLSMPQHPDQGISSLLYGKIRGIRIYRPLRVHSAALQRLKEVPV